MSDSGPDWIVIRPAEFGKPYAVERCVGVSVVAVSTIANTPKLNRDMTTQYRSSLSNPAREAASTRATIKERLHERTFLNSNNCVTCESAIWEVGPFQWSEGSRYAQALNIYPARNRTAQIAEVLPSIKWDPYPATKSTLVYHDHSVQKSFMLPWKHEYSHRRSS
jgi:hypothetical protein